jgi:hypothetical protein
MMKFDYLRLRKLLSLLLLFILIYTTVPIYANSTPSLKSIV